jgi:hypothetical protein
MNSKNSKKTSAARRRTTSPGGRWKSRLLDLGILLSTAVVALFVFSVAGRLSYTHAEKNNRPPRVLRTQVLNGCGESGVAAEYSDELMRAAVEEFRFDVIDRDNFDHFDVDESFMTVYTLTPDDAARLATALGIPPEKVYMAEQNDNPWGLDITIVLGQSWKSVMPREPELSETP